MRLVIAIRPSSSFRDRDFTITKNWISISKTFRKSTYPKLPDKLQRRTRMLGNGRIFYVRCQIYLFRFIGSLSSSKPFFILTSNNPLNFTCFLSRCQDVVNTYQWNTGNFCNNKKRSSIVTSRVFFRDIKN